MTQETKIQVKATRTKNETILHLYPNKSFKSIYSYSNTKKVVPLESNEMYGLQLNQSIDGYERNYTEEGKNEENSRRELPSVQAQTSKG